MSESGPLFIPQGFSFSAATAGIKASGKPDLGLILTGENSSATALFTKNLVVAAPIEVGRSGLSKSRGRVRAVVVNSGNANCATGPAGIRACKAVCSETARRLKIRPWEVFPSSTGIIGVVLPAEKINATFEPLIAAVGTGPEHIRSFAEAILTTDRRPKLASVPLARGRASITGIAKGAGMIHPQLATMLVYLLTDIAATPAELKGALRKACADTFNAISVDGDTSTNDTVLLLASGKSGLRFRNLRSEFQIGLRQVCRSLSEQIVSDGEGVQHVIRLRVEQARASSEALQVARAIAHSLLVKTAWAGADPNWGRILAAVGRSGIGLDPGKISIAIGEQTVCRGGIACKFDEVRAHQELSKPESRVSVKIGRGKASTEFLTTDLTPEYVRLNADYST
jgi:glutamate N-acetyltransferase / amino-acid N-acetyltransferase